MRSSSARLLLRIRGAAAQVVTQPCAAAFRPLAPFPPAHAAFSAAACAASRPLFRTPPPWGCWSAAAAAAAGSGGAARGASATLFAAGLLLAAQPPPPAASCDAAHAAPTAKPPGSLLPPHPHPVPASPLLHPAAVKYAKLAALCLASLLAETLLGCGLALAMVVLFASRPHPSSLPSYLLHRRSEAGRASWLRLPDAAAAVASPLACYDVGVCVLADVTTSTERLILVGALGEWFLVSRAEADGPWESAAESVARWAEGAAGAARGAADGWAAAAADAAAGVAEAAAEAAEALRRAAGGR